MKRWVKATVAALILVLVMPTPPGWGFMLTGGFKPAVSSSAVVAESGVRPYQVQKGDTLWGIASREAIDPNIIMAMNNLEQGSTLDEGQVLNLPYSRSRVHVVRAGDTLWDIATRYQVDVNDLMHVNGVTRPQALQIGQVLTVPGSDDTGRLWRSGEQNVSRHSQSTFLWPVSGLITLGYGWRHHRFHHGLDIAVPLNTPIRAAASGEVIFAGYKSVYGRAVIVKHNDGKCTLYGHAQKLLVHQGQHVCRGQVIARSGSTGNSTGPHVHFEVRDDKSATLNPLRYLR